LKTNRLRVLLAFMAMLPVFVMIGWLLLHREEARIRDLEDARQILGMLLDRIETTIEPTAPLTSVLTEELRTAPPNDAAAFEKRLRQALSQVVPDAWNPSVVRINVFDHDVKPLLWPRDEDLETTCVIWRGIMEEKRRNAGREGLSEGRAIIANANAALKHWVAAGTTLVDLTAAPFFGPVIQSASQTPLALAVFRHNPDPEKHDPVFGVVIRIPLEAIPPASYHAWLAAARLSGEEAAGLGILSSDGSRWLVRAGQLPDEVLARPPDAVDRVVRVPGGFVTARPLPAHAAGTLILYRKESFGLFRNPLGLAGLGALIMAAAGCAWLLAGILSGIGTGSLRRRIALAFLFAGIVPIGFSGIQGGMRVLSFDAVKRVEWETEAARTMTFLDRGFRDVLERYQERFARMIQGIARDRDGDIGEVSGRLASFTEAVAIEMRHSSPGGRRECRARTTDDQGERRLIITSPVIAKIMKDVFLEMRAAAGKADGPSAPGAKERLALPVHEMIGDAVPLKELFGRLGHITYVMLTTKTALLFCQTYRVDGDSLGGLFVGGTTMGDDSAEYIDDYISTVTAKNRPWGLFRINRAVVNPELPSIPRDFLRLTVRTQQTGSPCSDRVEFHDGPHLVLTSRPSYLQLGVLAARMPLAHQSRERGRLTALAAGGLLLAFGLAIGVAVVLSRRLLGPIRMLQKAAVEIGEGALDVRLSTDGRDELAALGTSFGAMAEGLRQRERMRRFLSESAWQGTAAAQGAGRGKGAFIEAAVLCSDIRGFTTLSEREAPAEVTAMLNEYFTAMDAVIRESGGEIDKLIGDAIQAVFRPLDGAAHPAIRAVEAGLEMRRALARLNETRKRRGAFPVENGVGIHFGKMISGSVGAAGGRQDFTVIGPAVGFAARLEAASKDGTQTKVMVSGRVAEIVGERFAVVERPSADAAQERVYEILRDRRNAYNGHDHD